VPLYAQPRRPPKCRASSALSDIISLCIPLQNINLKAPLANMYYADTPPYFLLAAGLFISITSGLAFSAVLKGSVGDWYAKKSTRSISKLRGFDLQLPFLGICLGSCVFLASGMSIFGFPTKIAYAMASPLILLSALLVWTQLRKNLAALESGNTRAFELDGF